MESSVFLKKIENRGFEQSFNGLFVLNHDNHGRTTDLHVVLAFFAVLWYYTHIVVIQPNQFFGGWKPE